MHTILKRAMCRSRSLVCRPSLAPPFSLASLMAAVLALAALGLHVPLQAQISKQQEEAFRRVIQPFMKRHCLGCHNAKETRGELDLSGHRSPADIVANFRRWGRIIEFVRDGAMPPEDVEQPTLAERKQVVDAIEDLLLVEAAKNAGDPGVVPPRRLSATEYDYSVRDLTGVDIRPTEQFPVDPAGGEGFDNTGEALAMSPSLLKKYLGAAEQVSHHLVLRSDGLRFAQFPVTSYNERKKLAEHAIIDFYRSREIDLAVHLKAAWKYKVRDDAQRSLSIQQWAAQQRLAVQPRYLKRLWDWLEQPSPAGGFERQLLERWQETPSSDAESPTESLSTLQREIEYWRDQLGSDEGQPIRSNAGNWPIQHLHDRQQAANARSQFSLERFRPSHQLVFPVIRAQQWLERDGRRLPKLYLSLESLLPEEAAPQVVVVERAVFSKADRFPRNANDVKQQEVTPLEDVLDAAQRSAWGLPVQRANDLSEPTDDEGKADQLDFEKIGVFQGHLASPGQWVIPLSKQWLERLDGKRLVVQLRLSHGNERKKRDGQAKDPPSPTESVIVRWSIGPNAEALSKGKSVVLLDPESSAATALEPAAARFCRVFPNRFFYVDDRRGLAAGFHLVEEFFRDDQPLCELLPTEDREEIDRLWRELHFITSSAETLLRGFVWFERSERHVLHDERFDFLRAEDPSLTSLAMLARFERVYLEKMGVKLKPQAKSNETASEPDAPLPVEPSDRYEMIHGFFEQIREGLATHNQLLRKAETRGQADIFEFASRAFRRPLRLNEREALRKLYQRLRSQGQSIEDAFRGVTVATLMAPDFCYRYSEQPADASASSSANSDSSRGAPLTDRALASRMSYFLWSSIPDGALLEAAEQGRLQEPGELRRQLNRMVKDPKASAFAREFFGQWLRYRDFLSSDSLNTKAFPILDADLRAAMFTEPERLATWMLRDNLPITTLLNSDSTFVNDRLAKHYGGGIQRRYRERFELSQTGRREPGKRMTGCWSTACEPKGEADCLGWLWCSQATRRERERVR